MGTYVTDAGFVKPTLLENVEDFGDALKGAMGDSLDVGETTPAGLLVGTTAKTISDAQDVDQELYTCADPGAATGVALDRLCALLGISRIAAAAARCEVVCYTNGANDGLIIDSGRQVRRVRGGLVFSLPAAFTISLASCREVYLTLSSVAIGDTVTLNTSVGVVSVTATTTSVGDMYNAIRDAFNAAQGIVFASRKTVLTQGNLLNQDCLVLTSPTVAFGYTPTTWTIGLIGTAALMVATTTGVQTVAPGEISEIVTPQANWLYALNLVTGISGRAVERDEELRLRRERSFREGYATEDAIRQALLDRVVGITTAIVVSNRTMAVDAEGRPPKSFEAVVEGGSDDEVAAVIWQTQPAGIESYAPTPPAPTGGYATVDSQGRTQYVKFSRPEAVLFDVRVVYSLYDEELFPGPAALADTLVSWAVTEYVLGKDVIIGRIAAAVYTVPGLESVNVEVKWHGSPTWAYAKLPVSARQRASLLAANIVTAAV